MLRWLDHFREISLAAICCAFFGEACHTEPVLQEHLCVWLDAQCLNTQGNAVSSAADGARVIRWADKSSHDNHATQSVPDRRPTLVADGTKKNGRAVHFRVEQPVSSHRRPVRVGLFAIDGVRGSQGRSVDEQHVAIRQEPLGASLERLWDRREPRGTAPVAALGPVAARSQRKRRRQCVGANGGEYRPGTFDRRGSLRRQAAGSAERRQARQDATRQRTHSRQRSRSAHRRRPQISPACEFFEGEIAEILLYDQALDTAQRRQIRRYLAEKYGLALAGDSRSVAADTCRPNEVIDNGYLPITVENPATPETKTLDPATAADVLDRDWLYQVGSEPLAQRAIRRNPLGASVGRAIGKALSHGRFARRVERTGSARAPSAAGESIG